MNNGILPVEVVFHPSWYNRHAGIVFDEDFFYNAERRVADERKMEQVLYEHFGEYGLGEDRDKDVPQIGAVHNAAGFLLSEMLGCEVEYFANSAPQVHCAHREDFDIDVDGAFETAAFKRLQKVVDELKKKYGYVCGDVNWGGVLNLALDLKGESIFMDMMLKPDECIVYFQKIAKVVERFFCYLMAETKTSSISVNRLVRLISEPVYVHSECSHTMISVDDYRKFLMPIDIEWSKKYIPYGIHYCGKDPHRYAECFSELPRLDFLDTGWGGDIAFIRKHLPNTFLNIRLDPVRLNNFSEEELRKAITDRVKAAENPHLTGVCCINMDDKTEDEKVKTIFRTVQELRKEYQK
jgi:hypothetical protein